MSQTIRFSFPLNHRMQAFLQLQEGLQSLAEAEQVGNAYMWLQSCADIRISLAGEQGRKPALPEVQGLITTMQERLRVLAGEHPQFQDKIMHSCDCLNQIGARVGQVSSEILHRLSTDALIVHYLNALQKQDWLGHKLGLPQALPALWKNEGRQQYIHESLQQLYGDMGQIFQMLHDYVPWEQCLAEQGSEHIDLRRDDSDPCGLLIIGLTNEQVQTQCMMPDISGNRLAVRLRFQTWLPGETSSPVEGDVSYARMLVPIG